MAKYRDALPQLSDRLFLSDGGLETTLVFHDGMDLPCFAAFSLLQDAAGAAHLRRYFQRYLTLARERGVGFVLESVTWRASPDWGARLDYTPAALVAANRDAIGLLRELRDAFETPATPIVISGCIGPRGDGYVPGEAMTPGEAEAYHRHQITALAEGGADLITAHTLTTADEAIGITRAAGVAGIPAVISFTVETDGRLPDGATLAGAITRVDEETGMGPAYYMVNCAHPTHFGHVLEGGADWTHRIRGVRANASCRSHAELDECETLDAGDPLELGARYRELQALLPALTVLGGCCGTDHRHIEAVYAACA